MSRWGDPGQDAEYCRGLSGTGEDRSPLCHCLDCAWRGRFEAAVEHVQSQPAHRITYKGRLQNLEAYRVTR